MTISVYSTESAVDVIIVGAGVSGMAAALELQQHGLRFKVLEGNSRVGGRTWTDIDAPGGPIDYGGMFIGETHRNLRKLGTSLGIETTSAITHGSDVYLVAEDRIVVPEGVFPNDLDFSKDFKESFRLLDKIADDVGWKEPWNSPQAAQLDAMTVQTWIDSNIEHPKVRLLHDHAVNSVLGANPSEVSMLYWAYYVSECEGISTLMATRGGAQNEWWVGGTGQISERIADKLGEDVLLDFPVASVEYTNDSVKVRSRANHIVEGRRVIIAMSPTNAHRIMFSPELPVARSQLQMRSPMGRMSKVQLRFDRAFWREKGFSGAITDIGVAGAYIFPGTKPTDTAETLIAFIGGSYHDEFVTLSETKQKNKMLDVLRLAFGMVPDTPIYFSVTDWTQQRWAQGGPVTFMPPGVLRSVGQALRDPVGPVLFAGTEASLMWSGYMEGAVRAGQEAAKIVTNS